MVGAGKSSREWILTISLALIVPAFALTGFLARMYHSREQSLAAEWLAEGSRQIQAGNAEEAVSALRTSLAYAPDDTAAALRLAEAEAAVGHDAEARSYLDAILTTDSGNGEANLARARLAVRAQNIPNALRYYHNAFYGTWPDNETSKPLQARLELSRFLLDRGDKADAEAELISLAAAAPPDDIKTHLRVGELFFQVSSPRNALGEFRLVLETNPENAEALKGAGTACLQLGLFPDAERYLARASRAAPDDAAIQETLKEARNILNADPFLRGLSAEAKQSRALAAFQTAVARLRACAAKLGQPLDSPPATSSATPPATATDLQAANARVQAMTPLLAATRMRAHPVQVTDVMELVFDIEKVTALKCGPPEGADLALLRLAQATHGAAQ